MHFVTIEVGYLQRIYISIKAAFNAYSILLIYFFIAGLFV